MSLGSFSNIQILSAGATMTSPTLLTPPSGLSLPTGRASPGSLAEVRRPGLGTATVRTLGCRTGYSSLSQGQCG